MSDGIEGKRPEDTSAGGDAEEEARVLFRHTDLDRPLIAHLYAECVRRLVTSISTDHAT